VPVFWKLVRYAVSKSCYLGENQPKKEVWLPRWKPDFQIHITKRRETPKESCASNGINKKPAKIADSLRAPTWCGILVCQLCIILPETKFLSSLKFLDANWVMDLRGIEPPDSWLTDPNPHQARPMTKILYHNFLIDKSLISLFPWDGWKLRGNSWDEKLKNKNPRL